MISPATSVEIASFAKTGLQGTYEHKPKPNNLKTTAEEMPVSRGETERGCRDLA